jgi:hypothetical protein
LLVSLGLLACPTREPTDDDDVDDDDVIVVEGPLIVQTIQGGRGYRVQGASDTLISDAWESVR